METWSVSHRTETFWLGSGVLRKSKGTKVKFMRLKEWSGEIKWSICVEYGVRTDTLKLGGIIVNVASYERNKLDVIMVIRRYKCFWLV